MTRMTTTEFKRIGKRNNRNAQKVEIDGIVFQSTFEGRRYMALKDCLNGGIITDLELQVSYPLIVNNVKVCDYFADFRYVKKDGTLIVEDAKGFRDALYRLKAKMFHAQEGFPIWESENTGSMNRNPILNSAYLLSIGDAFPVDLLSASLRKKINKAN